MPRPHCAVSCHGQCDCNCNNCKLPVVWRCVPSVMDLPGLATVCEIHRQKYVCFTCKRGWKAAIANGSRSSDMSNAEFRNRVLKVPELDALRMRLAAKKSIRDIRSVRSKLSGHARCGSCSKPGIPVGPDCRYPKTTDGRGWIELQRLVEVELRSFRSCRQSTMLSVQAQRAREANAHFQKKHPHLAASWEDIYTKFPAQILRRPVTIVPDCDVESFHKCKAVLTHA
jgi:hypothetical protein